MIKNPKSVFEIEVKNIQKNNKQKNVEFNHIKL